MAAALNPNFSLASIPYWIPFAGPLSYALQESEPLKELQKEWNLQGTILNQGKPNEFALFRKGIQEQAQGAQQDPAYWEEQKRVLKSYDPILLSNQLDQLFYNHSVPVFIGNFLSAAILTAGIGLGFFSSAPALFAAQLGAGVFAAAALPFLCVGGASWIVQSLLQGRAKQISEIQEIIDAQLKSSNLSLQQKIPDAEVQ